jgi:hypothetical protein
VQQRRQGGLSRYSRDPFAVMQQLSEEMDNPSCGTCGFPMWRSAKKVTRYGSM